MQVTQTQGAVVALIVTAAVLFVWGTRLVNHTPRKTRERLTRNAARRALGKAATP